MIFQNLLTARKDRILYVTINRESKLNALNKLTLAELHACMYNAFSDPQVGGIIVTGAGTKAFVAGADISEFAEFDIDQGRELAHEGHTKVFDMIENGNKPVIAAINGFALGGGLELAMACHIRIAADTARMGLPEVTLGIIPGYGGTQRLTQLVGKGKALEMIMTADMINASEALTLGLVNHVVAPDQLLIKAEEILNKILLRAPLAIASAITAINASVRNDQNGFEVEINEFSKCFGTDDFKAGVLAFMNKQNAHFTGK